MIDLAFLDQVAHWLGRVALLGLLTGAAWLVALTAAVFAVRRWGGRE